MNKQIVKQLMDIVLFLKQASASGGGMHPGGGAYPPKKVAPKPGMHPGGGGYSSREKRQYDPKGPHEGPRKGHYYKPGEREVGGVQVDVVTAPKPKQTFSEKYGMTEEELINRIEAREKQQEEKRNNPPPVGRKLKAGKLNSMDLEQRQKNISAILNPDSRDDNNLIRQSLKNLWNSEGSLTFGGVLDEKGNRMMPALISDSKNIDRFLDTIAELTSGEYQGKYAGRHLFKPLDKKQQKDLGYHHYNEDRYSFSFRGRDLNENKGVEDEGDSANTASGNRFRITIDKKDLVRKKAPDSIRIDIGFAPRDRGEGAIQELEWEFDGVPHREAFKRRVAAQVNEGYAGPGGADMLKRATAKAIEAGGDDSQNWYHDEDNRLQQR